MKLHLLKTNRNYRIIVEASLVNRLGDSIDSLSISWLLFQLTGNASLSALLYAVNYFPTIILQPICGGFVSKHNRKTIMVLSDLGRGIVVGTIALMIITNTIQPWMLFIFSFLISTFEAFRLPCNAKMITEVVERKDYTEAQAFLQSTGNIVMLAGTAVAGFVLTLGGVQLGLFIDALSFFLSAALLMLLKVKNTTLENTNTSTFKLVKEGFQYILSMPSVIMIAFIALAINALAIPINALSSAWCTTMFQKGPEALSILNAFYIIGMIIGSMIHERFAGNRKPSTLLILAFFALGIFYTSWLCGAVFHESILFYVFISVLPFMTGIFLAWANIMISVAMMTIIDHDYLTRVESVTNALCNAGIPIASLITSLLSSFLSIFTVFMIFFIISIIVAIALTRVKQLQAIDQEIESA